MCRHIVVSFHIMLNEGHALRNDMIQETLKIHEDSRIGIFINGDAGGGVSDKYSHHALVWHLTRCLYNVIRNDVIASTK